ncbi:MAG TPA: hypothetical protein VKA74_00285 [Myxococcota bacterium]|nr:hypothetical protein [Myxococcota bacterium]
MKALLESISSRFTLYDDAFRGHSLRERVLIGAMAGGLAFLAMDALMLRSVGEAREQVALRIERTQERIESLRQATTAELSAPASEEARRAAEESRRLRLQIARIEEQTRSRLTSLVPPRQILPLLETLLAESRGLRLLSLQSRPPARIGAQSPGEDEGEPEVLGTRLYRHGFQMEIEGSFAATLEYLRRVESSRWSLLWDRLDYRVERHPTARITIELQTISEEEEWIGV